MNHLRRYKAVFLLPGLLTLFLIIIFPLAFTIRVSFSSWSSTSPNMDFIGFDNFGRMLQDGRFWSSMLHLFVLVGISVFLQYVIGFALALAVWRDVRAKRFFRVLFLIPMMTTPVVIAAIWQMIFHESLGPTNDLLSQVGLPTVSWLTERIPAYISLIVVEVWQWTPFMFLFLLAGLLSLPKEPFMAAAIDGAGPVRTFRKVTFPLLAPVSVTALIIRLIEASKTSDTVYVLTSGGPGAETETPGYYLYIRGLKEQQTGYSGALSVTYLIVMVLILTVVSALLVRAFRARTELV